MKFENIFQAKSEQPKPKVAGKFKGLMAGAAMGLVGLAGVAEAQPKDNSQRNREVGQNKVSETELEVPASDIPNDWYEQTDGFRSADGRFEFIVGQGSSPDQSAAAKIAAIDSKMKSRSSKSGYKQLKTRTVQDQDGRYRSYVLVAKKAG